MNRQTTSKVVVTAVAVAGMVGHLVWPDLKIDAVTLGFLLLALVPWLAPIIKSIEVPGVGKVELQQEADPEATGPGGQAEKSTRLFDSRGFYTPEGLTQLINDSGFVETHEKVVGRLQVFRTAKQHTWLVTTQRQIFCILDDRNTRSSSRLIQWRLPIERARPVRARQSARGNPVIDVGPKKHWLYSVSLHAEQAELENEIKGMLDRAAGTTA